jgi:hypothetical protein
LAKAYIEKMEAQVQKSDEALRAALRWFVQEAKRSARGGNCGKRVNLSSEMGKEMPMRAEARGG